MITSTTSLLDKHSLIFKIVWKTMPSGERESSQGYEIGIVGNKIPSDYNLSVNITILPIEQNVRVYSINLSIQLSPYIIMCTMDLNIAIYQGNVNAMRKIILCFAKEVV